MATAISLNPSGSRKKIKEGKNDFCPPFACLQCKGWAIAMT
jgi:hypothetical protein